MANEGFGGGFLPPYPQQSNDRQKASGLVIILSYGPRLTHLVVSQADKVSVSGVRRSFQGRGYGFHCSA